MLLFICRLIHKAFLLSVVFFFAYLIYYSTTVQKMIYPMVYKDSVLLYSKEYGIDPYLVMSVIKVESRFSSKAESDSGAKGLMQIMPDTAEWAADHLDIAYREEMLFEPQYNIKLGCWYLRELTDAYRGDLLLVLAAYNAGQGNVNQWIKEGSWDGTFDQIQNIPFPETRSYVQKVMANYEKYLIIYDVNN